MTILETQRLTLRTLLPSDAEVMYDYRNNELCARYQRGQTKDLEGLYRVIERRANDVLGVEKSAMFAVVLRETGEMIGEIVVMPKDGTISMGYTFSYKHHRRGYAYEAISALLARLHADYPEWDYICYTDPENVASMGLLKKLGYEELGYAPEITSQVFGKWLTPKTRAEVALQVK